MSEPTVEQLQKKIEQLEVKNLELQARNCEQELQTFQWMVEFVKQRGPVVQATLQAVNANLAERRKEAE